MENIRPQLMTSRKDNFEGQKFIPYGEPSKIVSRDIVKRLIDTYDLEYYERAEIVAKIIDGAVKTFSILILIHRGPAITKFIETDQLQDIGIDQKLPFALPDLEKLDSEWAQDFYERQWEFSSPIFAYFTAHRFLHEYTRLPFLESTYIGEGAFGKVFEIHIHPSHSRFTKSLKVVRKELSLAVKSNPDYSQEIRVLSFLNMLEHPNITPLLGSYTYRGVHNLLFPKADTDLHKLFQSDIRPTEFQSDQQFVIALCGLMSAVDNLHRYASEAMNLDMIGCHHDIRPGNVLVENGTFVLADFGLSRLKSASLTSKSIFRKAHGYYFAPECQDAEDDFVKGTTSRPSDVWSAGCIIAETITYMKLGAEGVEKFCQQRKTKLGGYVTTHTFHSGNVSNAGVEDWLRMLYESGKYLERAIVDLIRSILTINPNYRPTAMGVLRSLRRIVILSFSEEIDALFKALILSDSTFKIITEEQRHLAWIWGFKLIADDEKKTEATHLLNKREDFDECIKIMQKLVEELGSWSNQSRNRRPSIRLEQLLDKLWAMIPTEVKTRMQRRLELKLLGEREVPLVPLEEGVSSTHPARTGQDLLSTSARVGISAAIKHMYELMPKPSDIENATLPLSQHEIYQRTPLHRHEVGLYKPTSGISRAVLIEQITYDQSWEGAVGDELFARIGAIVKFRNSIPKSLCLKTLRCEGYFHEPFKHTFGLVYQQPASLDRNEAPHVPLSLYSLIRETRNVFARPSLGARYHLGQALASLILELSSLNWFHKTFSSFHVLFFENRQIEYPQRSISDPYVIGFNHSRENAIEAFTTGPTDYPELLDYQHPRYVTLEATEYQAEFDFYSLGIVLLEIGVWRTVDSMVAQMKSENASPAELLDHILDNWLPLLNYYMGQRYMNAAAECLRCAIIDPDNTSRTAQGTGSAHLLRFEELVVRPLSKCSV